MTSDRRSLDIGFVHPGLGIGGAERLVLDAAWHLRQVGHRVTLFMADDEIGRRVEETRGGRLDIRIHGDFLPSHVGQRLRAPCAIARMAYLTMAMALSRRRSLPLHLRKRPRALVFAAAWLSGNSACRLHDGRF